MSEPHQLQSSEASRLIAADRLCEAVWDQEKYKLPSLVVGLRPGSSRQKLSLQECRQLLVYKSLTLEWHMRPRMAINPERYFLERLHEELNDEQRQLLDPSLHYRYKTKP